MLSCAQDPVATARGSDTMLMDAPGSAALIFNCTRLSAAAADCLLTEASSIFIGSNKRLEHFGGDIVAVELVELVEPEVKAGEVQVGRGVRVSSQIAEVLHEHEGAVEFVLLQQQVFGD